MSLLEKIQTMSSQEILEEIKKSELQEYGLCKQPVYDLLLKAKKESEEDNKISGVVAALNNADTDRVLSVLLKSCPEKIMEGISIASHALETEKKELYLPEENEELKSSLQLLAEKYGVTLKTGIVNIREARGSALLHIVTAQNLTEWFLGAYEEKYYVAVNDSQPERVSGDTVIEKLIENAGIEKEHVKALFYGYEYHIPTTEELQKSVKDAGIINGVLKVLTDKECIVQETEKRLLKSRKISCGKCVFCREGLIQLEHMQKETAEGRGKQEFIELTKEIGEVMCCSTPCTMGQNAARIALSAVTFFENEYEAHIKKKNCPAGVCTAFVNLYIDPAVCSGCGECIDVCPKDCIEGKAKYIHMIDEFDCTKCGKCITACPEEAILRTTGKLPKLPTRLTKVGKFKKR